MASKEQKLILVSGGARSGKSRHALQIAKLYKRKAFLATGVVTDEEMRERIARHQQERGPEWQTFEEPIEIAEFLRRQAVRYDLILIDCMTFWISNLLQKHNSESCIFRRIEDLVQVLELKSTSVIIVTNEVGSGIVPENALARQFRDLTGLANQKIAAVSDKVVLTVSGIPVEIK